MKSKGLLTTLALSLTMLCGCLDEVADAPDMSSLACTTEPLDDDSGVKIVCGGDSVGVVLNGKDGKDGKDGADGKDGEDGEDGTNGKNGKDGKDGTSCRVEENKDIDGFDVYCGDKKVGQLLNGKDGEKGADGTNGTDGKDGKDGTSCRVEENKDIDGFDVYCGDKKVGELLNGKDGEKGADGTNGTDGKDGKDGTSCSVVKNEKVNGYEVYCGNEFIGYLTNGKDGEKGADGTNGTDGKDGKDGTSCRVEENKDIDGFDVYCGDKKVGELHNGKDGEKGADGTNGTDGKDGKDGTSCRVEENKDIDGFDVYCGDKKVGQLLNGKDGEKGADGTNGTDGKDGKDGTSCRVEENKDIDGFDVYCGDKKVGELRNGKDAVLPSSSSIASSSSAAPSSSSKVSSSSAAPSSSSVASSSSATPSSSSVASSSSETSSSSVVSSSSETPSSSSVEQLSEKCKTLRATTNVFNSLYDVLGCTRSDEKVAIILRHAQRDINKYGENDGLIDVGRAQAKQVGEKLKKLNLDDFHYMYTSVKRTAETAQIIAINKGQDVPTNLNDWHQKSIKNLTDTTSDLKEAWYVKPYQNANNCKGSASWGWSSYSKIAYEEFDDDNNRQNCKNTFYPIDSMIDVFTGKYFTYEKMHKYTLAISHDQYLVPFVITISNKQIHDDVKNSKYDLRFHKHDRDINWQPDFNYWINYLAGVVLIVDADNNVIKLPVKALDDGFLREYKNP